MSLLDFSSDCLSSHFFLLLWFYILCGMPWPDRKWSNRDPKEHVQPLGKNSLLYVICLHLLAHLTFFFTRWVGGGQSRQQYV